MSLAMLSLKGRKCGFLIEFYLYWRKYMNETIEAKNVVENEELLEVFVPSKDGLVGWGAGGCGSGGFPGE